MLYTSTGEIVVIHKTYSFEAEAGELFQGGLGLCYFWLFLWKYSKENLCRNAIKLWHVLGF